MSDYELYYWSAPFRGQFVRAVLAYAGKTWTEADDAAISNLMDKPVSKMPVPFMGPPLLIDKKADFAIAQMRPSSFISARRCTSCPPPRRCAR